MSFDMRALKQLTYHEESEQLWHVAGKDGMKPGVVPHDLVWRAVAYIMLPK